MPENRCVNSFADWILFKDSDNESFSVYSKTLFILVKFCYNLIHCPSYIASVTRVSKLKISCYFYVNVCYFKSEYNYKIFESAGFFSLFVLLGCSDVCDKGGSICVWNFTRDNAQPAL